MRLPAQAAERARLEEEVYGNWRAGEWTRIDTDDMSCRVRHVAGLGQSLVTHPGVDRALADAFAQRHGFANIDTLLPLLRANEERWGLPITEPWL